jgi:ABC-type dipeptide/oligopeptide/nickel transport system ATPase subunit
MTNLKEIIEDIRSIYYLDEEDESLIHIILAIILSRLQPYQKLWIIIIGDSGSGKSSILSLFENKERTKSFQKLTANTFISGRMAKEGKGNLDQIKDLRNKVLIFKDLAQNLSSNKDEQKQIYSQLVDIYDGELKRGAYGVDKEYENLNISFIANATPKIDEQSLINNTLGTRFLLYRMEDKNELEILKKVEENSEKDLTNIIKNIKNKVNDFLDEKKYQNYEIPEQVVKEIKDWVYIGAKLRAEGKIDYSNAELVDNMSREIPTRLFKQFLILYRALRSLEDSYSEEKIMKILKKISLSLGNPLRINILEFLIKNHILYPLIEQKAISGYFRISGKKVLGELNILWHLGFLTRTQENYSRKFRLDLSNPFVIKLAEYFGIDLELDKKKVENPLIVFKFKEEGYF